MTPRDLHVARVAVVATIAQGRYAKKSSLDQSAPPPRWRLNSRERELVSIACDRSNSRA